MRGKQILDTDKLVNVINDIETIMEDNEGTLIDMAEMIVRVVSFFNGLGKFFEYCSA
jgi:hypothetical protein